jgi:predicted  nucleic acid-binding Zn-ribbon protein
MCVARIDVMSVDLLHELRRPCKWVGDARVLLSKCREEIASLRERNAAYQQQVHALEQELGALARRAKRLAKSKAYLKTARGGGVRSLFLTWPWPWP